MLTAAHAEVYLRLHSPLVSSCSITSFMLWCEETTDSFKATKFNLCYWCIDECFRYQTNRPWSPSTWAAAPRSALRSGLRGTAARSDSSALQWGSCTRPHPRGWTEGPVWGLHVSPLMSWLLTRWRGKTGKMSLQQSQDPVQINLDTRSKGK